MNKFERLTLPLHQLPAGDTYNLTLFRLQGTKKGPHAHIQANVHGAELQGNAVIYWLTQYLLHNDFCGSVTLIPHANPMGVNDKMGAMTYGRFSSISGDNWNRLYTDIFSSPSEDLVQGVEDFVKNHTESTLPEIKRDYKTLIYKNLQALEKKHHKTGLPLTKKLFLTLQKVAAGSDIVLDLHTGPRACRYIYSAEYQKESVRNFDFPYVLHIPNEFAGAMDEATFINWYRLYQEFKRQGVDIPLDFESYTLELGSEERIHLEEAKEDAARILNYLATKGMIKKSPWHYQKTTQKHAYLKDYKTYYAPRGGMVEYIKAPGDHVKESEVLCRFLCMRDLHHADDFSNLLTEIKAERDCIVINHIPSGAVSEGMELYQVLENYWEI